MEKKKIYKSAPLPFMGQKRKFLRQFEIALKNYPPDATYVDLFGGSGLLSHTVKSIYPNANVIYNDFDNYSERLRNVDQTNKLIEDLRSLLVGCEKDKKITGIYRERVLDRLCIEEKRGYIDFITISSSLLFSMNYALNMEQFKRETLYNCIRNSKYDVTGYLDGINVVRSCYKELFSTYQDNDNVVFLVDPPYLSTETNTYKNYWRLKDYLDVLDVLRKSKYFYFTSNKSSIIELCEWIETKTPMSNPFNGAMTKTVETSVNFKSSYTDIMIFKQ